MTNYYSPEEDATIRDSLSRGVSAAQIGRDIDRRTGSVIERAKMLGCWASPFDEDGWRMEGRATLRRMWAQKDGRGRFAYSVRHIASKMKHDTDAVAAKAEKMGLEKRDPPKSKDDGFPSWMEMWARRAGAAPERAVESAAALYAFHPLSIGALDAVFDQRRFCE